MNNEVLEQLKQEYNEALKRMQDIGEIIANCADIDTSHCGQDADMDDACCSVSGENHQPEGYTYKDLLGMKVICVGGSAMKCEDCSWNCDNCVKVELVGGDYLCLAKQPAVTGLDDSPKSWEDVYRENMELVRRHSIEQSEANQRLLKALRSDSEETKKTVINFDEEESNIMDDIKEKTEDFLNYLDGIFNTKEE